MLIARRSQLSLLSHPSASPFRHATRITSCPSFNAPSSLGPRCFSDSPQADGYTLWRWGAPGGSNVMEAGKADVGVVPSPVTVMPEADGQIRPGEIASLAAGPGHCFFIARGRLFASGRNKFHQLGVPHEREEGQTQYVTDPAIVHFPSESTHICSAACGAYHSAAITEDDRLFTWGWGGSFWSGVGGLGLGGKVSHASPVEVPRFWDEDDSLAQVACGYLHTIVLTTRGSVFCTGKGEFGRLGRGHSGDQHEFVRIPFFDEMTDKPVKVSAGTSFSSALTGKGEVYVWGRNDCGQLGLADSTGDMYSSEGHPRVVRSLQLEGVQVVDIACGDTHMSALSSVGILYYWGGRIWMEPRALNLDPRFQNAQIKGRVSKIGSGHMYSIALTEDGLLYSWGKHSSGCLGRQGAKDNIYPVQIPPEVFNDDEVVDVACGSYRVLALSRPRR